MLDNLVIGMAGSGGDGIVSASESLVSSLAEGGYFALMTKSFGSQIRGGESSCRVRLSSEPVLNIGGTLDVAVALNWDDFLRFGGELPVGGHTVVVYEAATGVAPDKLPLPGITPAESIPVPIGAMAREYTGSDKGKNTVVLGLLAGWFGIAPDPIMAGIRRKFAKKGEDMLARNEKAFFAGVE